MSPAAKARRIFSSSSGVARSRFPAVIVSFKSVETESRAASSLCTTPSLKQWAWLSHNRPTQISSGPSTSSISSSPAVQPSGDTVVVFDKTGGISLPHIGQHAEKVMGAKADRHRARFRSRKQIGGQRKNPLRDFAVSAAIHAPFTHRGSSSRADIDNRLFRRSPNERSQSFPAYPTMAKASCTEPEGVRIALRPIHCTCPSRIRTASSARPPRNASRIAR